MRHRRNLIALALITILTAFAIIVVWPDMPTRYLPDFIPWPRGNGLKIGGFDREAMRLGLDLKGGTYVLLEADTSVLPPDANVDEALEGAENIIERRVNAFGVAETEIQREGANRLSVQLPGIDPDEAQELIGKTALLTFKQPKLDENRNIICRAEDGSEFAVPGARVIETEGVARCIGGGGTPPGEVVWEPAMGTDGSGQQRPLTGRDIKSNSEVIGGATGPVVRMEFSGDGALVFEEITKRLLGLPLGIFLDETLIGAPRVNQIISGGQTVIEGLNVEEARRLAIQINAGALPVPLTPIQVTEVDATLGDDTVRMSVQAGLIGILAVMAFMILYYRLPGVLAALALIVYASTLLLIFKLWPITITLAGIAAFVLSVGMAVDANILVFERTKEELRGGRSLPAAIEAGFDRAWSSIRDSNVSTLITCIILWWFGNTFNAALVKGFALTLAIGVLVSMFSAIFVTRTFLRLLVGTPMARNMWLFGAEPVAPRVPAEATAETIRLSASRPVRRRPFMLDFVQRRGWYFLLSAVFLVPGMVSLLIAPALKPGIEFTSGATFTFQFEDPNVAQEDVRAAFVDLGHPQARVQKTSEGAFIVRTTELAGLGATPPVGPAPPSERDIIQQALIDRFGPMVDREGTVTNNFQNFNSVSEIVSREIGRNATIAVIAAAGAILLYISWAFRSVPKAYRYGLAAVIAALHDTLFVVGAFSIFGKVFGMEINTMFITGLLTVIGFSVHDTIVVFDRIRENVGRNPDVPFSEVVNASLTETLARSLNTSVTLVFTIVALLLLGGVLIQSFLLVLLLGVIAGTYSSIFIASQILVSWEEGDVARLLRRLFLRRPVPVEA